MHILIADKRGNEMCSIPRGPIAEAVTAMLWSGVVVHRFLIADRYGRKVGTVPPIVFGGFEQMIRTGAEA